MRALVTGATGFVGSHLVDLLLERGWSVRCTVRRTSDLRWLDGKPFGRVEADLRDAPGLAEACRGVDTVFHVAGVLSAPSYAKFHAGNVVASRNMVEAAVRAGVRRFLHVSTVAAGGPSNDGRALEESDDPRPVSKYGRTKLTGERAVRERGGEIEVTVVRPPVVYGPRDWGLLQLFQTLSKGLRLSVGGRKRISIVHVRDLVEGMFAAATSQAGVGQVYYIANDEPVTMNGTMAQALKALGRRRSIGVHVTDGFMLMVGSLFDRFSKTGIFGRDKALEMTQKAWVCSTEKARRELGFRARVGLEEGLRGTLEWYRARGLL